MSTADNLLQAIIESPDDDAPRLVYADFLEERGEVDQATFIRVQCELARLAYDHSRRVGLMAQEKVLLKKYSDIWSTQLRQFPFRYFYCEFRRGFVADVLLDAADFLAHAEKMYRLQPIISAKLSQAHGCFEQMITSQHITRLRELSLPNAVIGDEAAADLANSPVISNLKTLDLAGNVIEDAGVHAVASSPHLAGLAFLNLESNPVGPRGMASVANSEQMSRLEKLWVGNHISHEGVRVGDLGLRSLAASKHLKRLANLGLVRSEITDTGLEALASSTGLSQLRFLDLTGNSITDAGLVHLARAKGLSRLTMVNLKYTRVKEEGVAAILSSRRLPELKVVCLYDVPLSRGQKRRLQENFEDRVQL